MVACRETFIFIQNFLQLHIDSVNKAASYSIHPVAYFLTKIKTGHCLKIRQDPIFLIWWRFPNRCEAYEPLMNVHSSLSFF